MDLWCWRGLMDLWCRRGLAGVGLMDLRCRYGLVGGYGRGCVQHRGGCGRAGRTRRDRRAGRAGGALRLTSRCGRLRRAGAARSDHALTAELPRTAGGRNRRPTAIHAVLQRGIGSSGLGMLGLRRRRCGMRLPPHGKLCRRRLRTHAAGAAIEAGVVHRAAVGYRRAVGIGEMIAAKIIGLAIVVEATIAPASTGVTVAAIAEPVVDAAVIADAGTPVRRVPQVESAAPAPVARRPQQPDHGRLHPGAGNPVVAGRTVLPVAWCPDVAVTGHRRLVVNGQFRRRQRNRHADALGQGRGCDRNRGERRAGQQGRQQEFGNTHNCSPPWTVFQPNATMAAGDRVGAESEST